MTVLMPDKSGIYLTKNTPAQVAKRFTKCYVGDVVNLRNV
jgi:hypothetical protein